MTEKDAAPSAPLAKAQEDTATALTANVWQTAAGLAIACAAVWLAWGTWRIPVAPDGTDAGTRWLPGMCAGALLLCGGWLVWEARHGGWRNPAALSGRRLQVTPGIWVSAGILLGGGLIARSGFVLAATLCYLLALQGLRAAAHPGQLFQVRRLGSDALTGAVIAVSVFVLFTRVLGVALPAGWLTWS